MAGSLEWVLLAYRMPREPSNPRVAVWRKLRRLGVVQVVDGLVALPADARTREQLDWIADEVVDAGGEATTWLARLTSARQERELAARMAAAVATDYEALAAEAEEAMGLDAPGRRRTLARLRRELHRIGQRDHFPPPPREAARRALERLAAVVDEEAAR